MSDGRLLEVRDLAKRYRSGPGTIEVLRGLELTVGDGETVAIVGDSGVGKTTLLHVIGGLEQPEGGRVLFRGADVYEMTPATRATYRNSSIGFIFQFHHLLPEFTAVENVEMPFRVGRVGGGPERSTRLLERLGLEGRLHHRPGALSGGEQQRVAIARSLALEPPLVLADEPTGNLDPTTGNDVFRLFRELQAERGFSLVLATHSERLARDCDRILRLEAGSLQPMDDRAARTFFGGLGTQETRDPML